jgi:hypothetical protein
MLSTICCISPCNAFYNSNNSTWYNSQYWLQKTPSFHGHSKQFFWRLWTVWARALTKVRQPCTTIFKTVQQHNRSTTKCMREEGQNATARLVSQLLQYLQWWYCFVIERPWVRLSILKSIIQNCHVIPQSLWRLLGQHSKLGSYRFLPRHLQFIIHSHNRVRLIITHVLEKRHYITQELSTYEQYCGEEVFGLVGYCAA